MARIIRSGFKKGCALLYRIERPLIVYWSRAFLYRRGHLEFPFFGGSCLQGEYLLMCKWNTLSTPKKDNLDNLGTPSRRRQLNYRGPVRLGLGALNKPLLS
jgi:hypothetical protein